MIDLIRAATLSQTNEERKTAEATLLEMRDKNTPEFITQIAEIFNSSQIASNIREASGTILATSIVGKRKNGQLLWDSLDTNAKTGIKNMILSVMIDMERSVRRAAANIVSTICSIELPRQEWEGIVEKICNNINNDNQIIKEVSILALGFICERMKDKANFQFPVQTQEAILTGIVVGLKENSQILVNIALKALRDSVGSLTQLLKDANYREFLLKKAGEMVMSQKYSVLGLQILGEFVRYNYDYMGSIIGDLFNLLAPIIANSNNEDACVAGTEVWQNLAAEFRDSSHEKNHISGQVGSQIVASLLKNLCIMKEDEDDNPINDSASKALQTIFDNGSTEYKDLILSFVGNTINHEDWKFRQASIKAFSVMLHGLPTKESNILVDKSIEQWLNLLQDQSLLVQDSVIQSLIIITEECGGAILKKPNFLQYLQLIIAHLKKSESFFKSICKIIENLCEEAKFQKLYTFHDIAPTLVQMLLDTCLSPEASLIVINAGVSTIMSVIEVSNNHALAFKQIQFVLDNFDNLKLVKEVQRRQLLSACFFTLIQTCLISLRNTEINMETLLRIYQLVTTHFQEIRDVNADGLYVASALSLFFSEDPRLIMDFWTYVVHALSKYEQPQVFRATLSCIADFSLCYHELLGEKLSTFLPTLVEMVREPTFNREIKLQILACISEVFLNCGQVTIQYLKSVMDTVMLCCEGAIQMVTIDFSYSQTLKSTIVQTLMCIIHGINLNQPTACKDIQPYIHNIFMFAQMSCDRSTRPTVAYIEKCIALLSDFGQTYPHVTDGQLGRSPFIAQLVNILNQHNQDGSYTRTIKYARERLR